MFRKRKLLQEISELKHRIAELEERICPCEQHDWKVIDTEYVVVDESWTDAICKYKCTKCGKVKIVRE